MIDRPYDNFLSFFLLFKIIHVSETVKLNTLSLSITISINIIIITRRSYCVEIHLTNKAPNTTIADFANTVDPDETAHNEPSHLDLQCLPSCFLFFNIIQFIFKVFRNFADIIFSSAFLAHYEIIALSRDAGRYSVKKYLYQYSKPYHQ